MFSAYETFVNTGRSSTSLSASLNPVGGLKTDMEVVINSFVGDDKKTGSFNPRKTPWPFTVD